MTIGEGCRRISKVCAVKLALKAMSRRVEPHGMKIHPLIILRPKLDTNRKPVGLYHIFQRAKYLKGSIEVGQIDGQIKVAMLPSLPAHERIYPPATRDPRPHVSTI